MAACRMFDVFGDESRPAGAGRALRGHVKSQL